MITCDVNVLELMCVCEERLSGSGVEPLPGFELELYNMRAALVSPEACTGGLRFEARSVERTTVEEDDT